MATQPNYTEEQIAQIVEMYQDGEDLDTIASEMGRTIRSIRSKLVREGVYVAKPKPVAEKKDGPTKKELLGEILKLDPDFPVDGLMPATKVVINHVYNLVADAKGE